MAVYTQVTPAEAENFLRLFGFCKLLKLSPTTDGIENTNYFIDALDSQQQPVKLVLTLFEQVSAERLPYFVKLTTHLQQAGIPVPAPYVDHQQQAMHELVGKPCLLVPRFAGHHPITPSLGQCETIATTLASIHRASSGFNEQMANVRGAAWRRRSLQQLRDHLPTGDCALLDEEIPLLEEKLKCELPKGITHGDLFLDNSLFEGEQLCGIIDFYNACHDEWVYDLAILINDWCSHADGSMHWDRYHKILHRYQQQRPFTDNEKQCWPWVLRCAALRFWLSRLISWHFPEQMGQLRVKQKDPQPTKTIWLDRKAQHQQFII